MSYSDNYCLSIGQQIVRWNPEQHCEHCVILVPVPRVQYMYCVLQALCLCYGC